MKNYMCYMHEGKQMGTKFWLKKFCEEMPYRSRCRWRDYIVWYLEEMVLECEGFWNGLWLGPMAECFDMVMIFWFLSLYRISWTTDCLLNVTLYQKLVIPSILKYYKLSTIYPVCSNCRPYCHERDSMSVCFGPYQVHSLIRDLHVFH